MTETQDKRPNVVFIITDDQGYGDLGCTGNPWLKTPHIDALHAESCRMNDFHVSPLCTPTRGSLMTGNRPIRNGAWATCWGRSILNKTETTIADVFAANGYRTGLFGKWHLGDNYPYRPQDRGFHRVVAHKGGGVGQTPDYWGNNYFDDTYFHNDQPVPHEGYCTDIWFDEAAAFIREDKHAPFFAVIATNAPHSPFLVAAQYRAPYDGDDDIVNAAFYGMIANIDENVGRLRGMLKHEGIADDTIVIFMTDNGSSGGCHMDRDGYVTHGYNAGMRGKKGSYYEGGHRVPFFLHWPRGGLNQPRDVDDLALHIDFAPTLMELCGLEPPRRFTCDGRSLAPLIRGEADELPEDRVSFIQIHQGHGPPEKSRYAALTRRWRLLHGKELYDVKADPEQRADLAQQHPDVVERLAAAHDAWWAQMQPHREQRCAIALGNDAANPTRLDAMDVMGDVAWQQRHVAIAQKSTGNWFVDVEQPGMYRFALRRWPAELDLPIDANLSPDQARQLANATAPAHCRAIAPLRATVRIFDEEHAVDIAPGDKQAAVTVSLDRTGETELTATFSDASGDWHGAYYVSVERLASPA